MQGAAVVEKTLATGFAGGGCAATTAVQGAGPGIVVVLRCGSLCSSFCSSSIISHCRPGAFLVLISRCAEGATSEKMERTSAAITDRIPAGRLH